MSIDQAELKEGLTVQSSDGEWLGTVDHVEGESLKLKKGDSADGQHHYIPLTLVEREEDGTIFLSCTATEAQNQWSGEESEESDELGAEDSEDNTELESSEPSEKTGGSSAEEGLNINQRGDQPQTLVS